MASFTFNGTVKGFPVGTKNVWLKMIFFTASGSRKETLEFLIAPPDSNNELDFSLSRSEIQSDSKAYLQVVMAIQDQVSRDAMKVVGPWLVGDIGVEN